MISVIIPCFNEERILLAKRDYFTRLSCHTEIIFVDGGSDDGTVACAQEIAAVLTAPKGRARQMNCAAKAAHGNILFFHHVDTEITIEQLSQIEQCVVTDGYVGGCFHQAFAEGGLLYQWIAFTGNIRARLTNIFYGDQGIFVTKEAFQSLGGFPETDLCEDVLFTRKLRQHGKVCVLPSKIICSARRFKGQGIIKTFILNRRVNMALSCGQDLKGVARRYADIR